VATTTLDLARYTPEAVPAALAEWHRAHEPGATLRVDGEWHCRVDFDTVALGAGTTITERVTGLGRGHWVLRREPTLADLVAPKLGALLVGLNPSGVAAETGVPYGGATNRFWGAAVDAGLVPAPRDPWRAFSEAHVGFSDLVKRATPRADGLTKAEYAAGAERLRTIVAWLEPRVVCFAGLTGYRTAVDATAVEGEQPARFGGARAYVMPNPSGANAHVTRDGLVEHLRAVAALAVPEPAPNLVEPRP
jgi:TDG/mug DNA glycosylase family protein